MQKGIVTNIETLTSSKNTPYIKATFEIEAGKTRTYSIFDDALIKACQEAHEQQYEVVWTVEKKGNFFNLVSLEPAPIEQDPQKVDLKQGEPKPDLAKTEKLKAETTKPEPKGFNSEDAKIKSMAFSYIKDLKVADVTAHPAKTFTYEDIDKMLVNSEVVARWIKDEFIIDEKQVVEVVRKIIG